MPIKIKSVPVGGGGAVAPTPVEWTEVSSSAGLTTALATGGANILLTANFNITAAIAASAGRYLIAKKDGVQVSFTGNGQITAASVNTVFVWHFSCWDRVAPTLVVNNTGVFGAFFQSTANIQHEGFLSVDFTIHSAYQPTFGNNRHNMMALSIRTNGSSPTLGTGSIELVDAECTAGTPYLYLKNSASRVLMRGNWRPDDGSSAATATCGLFIAQLGFQSTTQIGSIEFLSATSNPCVAIVGTSGPVEVGSISCYTASTPRVGLLGQAKLSSSYVSPIFGANGSTNFKPVYENCYLINPRWVSANGAIMRNCKVAALATFPSGSLPEFYSCRLIGSTITFASGSAPLLDNCAIDSAVVVNSGAAARITKLQSAAGTLTNNDPLSVVTLSEDPSWDTTPSTRRFNNATLDAILSRLRAYYDLKDADLAFTDKSPSQRYRPIQGARSTGITADSSGLIFGDTGDWAVGGEFSFLADAEFSIGFNFTPVDATPASNRILLGVNPAAGVSGIGIDNNTSGGLSLWSNSAYRITGAAALSDGVESYIELVRRYDSGTLTWHLFVDGVDVGSSTAGIVDLLDCYLLPGRFNLSVAANTNPGTMNSLSLWDLGHSDAQAVAAASNPSLIGAGL